MTSGFTEAAHQAASIPAVAGSLVGAGVVYLVAQRWWSGVGDAFRIVPIFYALAVTGALVCVVLLVTRVRLIGDRRAGWVATGIAVAGAAALGQATAVIRLANAPLQVDGDGLAALYLLWHAALVVFALGAMLTPRSARLRWTLVLLFGLAIVAAITDPVWAVGPNLVDAGDRFTPLYRWLQAGLTLASIATVGLWLVSCGRRPTRPEVWIAIALGLAALDMMVASAAGQLFESLWWSSAALRAAQFVVPAVGLLADALRLMGLLHLHERSLTQRLEHERQVALELLAGQPGTAEEEQRIRRVLEQRAFRTVFQPIYSLHTGRLAAVEALSRFSATPTRPPDRWFDDAVRCGLGVELELATLESALEAAAGLPDGVALSVNLSPPALSDPRLRRCLEAAPTPGLIVEITEHAAVDDYHRLAEALTALRQTGVLLAIDDAGAGFASLQHIVQLAPDIIKLDMSLTRDIDRDPVRRTLALSLSGFAQEMGIELIAEGVETAHELQTLRAIGTHAAQGYLLGRPGDLDTDAIMRPPEVLHAIVGATPEQPQPRPA